MFVKIEQKKGMSVNWLNYHHLYYFYRIVEEGGVNKAARELRLSQSTLSAQLRTLEESLGARLFEREGRSLHLTDAGKVALSYAEEIFKQGEALRSWFSEDQPAVPHTVRIGALSPLSKNLQFEMIRPLIMEGPTRVKVVEGDYPDLLDRLRRHRIDLLISNIPTAGTDSGEETHLLGEMPMYLVGRPPFKIPARPFPEWLTDIPLFLPTSQTFARSEFDALLLRAGITPQVRAEVDDMALLRLLALSGAGLALVPEIGVKFELEEKKLLRMEKLPGVTERFYALTPKRKGLSEPVLALIESGKSVLEEMRRGRRGPKR